MRYVTAVAVGLFCLSAADHAVAQYRLLEVMHWKFHGPIESIVEREYKFDYDTLAIATEAENSRVYRFDESGRLATIEGTDPYGKTTYTLGYDDAGRLWSLRREREVEGRKKFGEIRTCERDEDGQISALAIAEFVGIVSIKLQRKIENEAEGNRRMIKTYEPKEDGGRGERMYLFEDDRLLSILKYDGYTKPDRVSEANRYNKQGLWEASISYSLASDPERITDVDNYKYEFDSRGNWISRTRHTKWREDRVWAMGRVTRDVKYRDE